MNMRDRIKKQDGLIETLNNEVKKELEESKTQMRQWICMNERNKEQTKRLIEELDKTDNNRNFWWDTAEKLTAELAESKEQYLKLKQISKEVVDDALSRLEGLHKEYDKLLLSYFKLKFNPIVKFLIFCKIVKGD